MKVVAFGVLVVMLAVLVAVVLRSGTGGFRSTQDQQQSAFNSINQVLSTAGP